MTDPNDMKPSDKVRVVELHRHSRFHELGVKVGCVLTLRRIDREPACGEKGWLGVVSEEHPSYAPWAKIERVSPVGEAEFYGTMPSVLPETLPDGKIWTFDLDLEIFGAQLDRAADYPRYRFKSSRKRGQVVHCAGSEWGFCAKEVDWTSIPRRALAQPVPPASEAQNVPGSAGSADVPTREDGAATPLGEAKHSSAQPVEPGRPDPYVEHSRSLCNRGLEYPADDRSTTPASELLDQRIAAARRRHLDQLKAELDRPVKRDAADWDAEDAEPIYVS
jgi:hypothetical protein